MSPDVYLGPLEAAERMGISSELLFQYTKSGFAKSSGLRSLNPVEQDGKTRFLLSELDAFDALIAGAWPCLEGRRPALPKAIADHLRVESRGECARCGSGVGLENAHIRPWAESHSHHHANLFGFAPHATAATTTTAA